LGRVSDRIGVAHPGTRRAVDAVDDNAQNTTRKVIREKRATATIYREKLTSCRGKTSTSCRHALCMTAVAGGGGIDLDVSHVISARPVPTTAVRRIASLVASLIVGASAGVVAGSIAGPILGPLKAP
jgi:hypothetical protein